MVQNCAKCHTCCSSWGEWHSGIVILVDALEHQNSPYSFIILFYYALSRPDVFCEKGVLRNFLKFTVKHLCQSLFFNKVAEHLFLQNTSGGCFWLYAFWWRPVHLNKMGHWPGMTEAVGRKCSVICLGLQLY